MKDNVINCPKCGYEIPVEEVLTHQIRESLKTDLEKDIKIQEKKLADKDLVLKDKETHLDQKVEALLKERSTEIEIKIREKLHAESIQELSSLKEELEEKSKKLQAIIPFC